MENKLNTDVEETNDIEGTNSIEADAEKISEKTVGYDDDKPFYERDEEKYKSFYERDDETYLYNCHSCISMVCSSRTFRRYDVREGKTEKADTLFYRYHFTWNFRFYDVRYVSHFLELCRNNTPYNDGAYKIFL